MNKLYKSVGAAGALVLAGLVAPGTASAAPPSPQDITVAFDAETAGVKPNGYASAESPGVLFYDTSGANLRVQDFGVQSHGLGLGVFGDDASALEIRLSSPTTAIEMAFGNDDPAVTNASDQAQLTLYRSGTQVAQVHKNVNSNDVMDQTIAYTGGKVFNRAVFQYVDATGSPKNLIEIVDDIEVAPLCTVSGNSGNNVLKGTAGPDVICGDSGNDVIKGLGGRDLIYPGPGSDNSNGGSGGDYVQDGAGNDRLRGGGGTDELRAASGNDVVNGGSGKDEVYGGTGKDKLNGGGARDRCDGGPGRDTARACEVTLRIP